MLNPDSPYSVTYYVSSLWMFVLFEIYRVRKMKGYKINYKINASIDDCTVPPNP